MRLNDFIEGLKIVQPYYKDPNGYYIEAEHDRFSLYAPEMPLSPKDIEKMRNLGWWQETDDDGDELENYDSETGWTAYT